MHFFVVKVVSTRANKALESHSEAYVSCWINQPMRESALEKAKALIHGQGWTIAEIVEDYPITRRDYSQKPEGLDYYEQALVDGEVLVFFVPKGTRADKGPNPTEPFEG